MAIVTRNEGGKIVVELTNGHSAALEKVVKDYKLLGAKEALSFILSVMSEADGNGINNGKGVWIPADTLKVPPPPPAQSNA